MKFDKFTEGPRRGFKVLPRGNVTTPSRPLDKNV
jgi:hypothetical protein